jgi:hypothetical protein
LRPIGGHATIARERCGPATLAAIVRPASLLAILVRLARLEPRFRCLNGGEPRRPSRQLRGQLVAADVRPMHRLFGRIDRLGLRRERRDLRASLAFLLEHPPVTHRLMLARVGLHLGASDRQRAELHDAGFAGHPHDLHEQRLEGRQWPAANMRYATSSSSFRAIRRDENVPVASAYTSTVTILCGSNG